MIIEILAEPDVKGFIIVTMVLVIGFSSAFSISMPDSKTFGMNQYELGGPFHGVLVMFESMLGAFDLSDYENTLAIGMFVVFGFLMVVVMFNLLIAIM